MRNSFWMRRLLPALTAVVAALAGSLAQAEEGDGQSVLLEEVIVTAQRQAESVQEVPIAVTALTGDMLAARQTINPSDLQMNAPNVSFTATNFGSSSFSIRGIGRLVIAATGEAGVSTHLNEVAVATNLNSIEFFDMERVEILRGPQGTLFGRNATGGAINFVTKMPDYESAGGFVDFEVGDYNHSRVKGAFNLPFNERMGLRLAGFKLDRDGYVENLAYGRTDANGNSLTGIDDDVDGRDVLALRATFAWDISDQANLWLQYSRFDEDDDRTRISNQVCVRNPLPATGCLADEFGFESPNLGSTTGGIFAALAGAVPLGVDGSDPALYAFPPPRIDGFRQMHTDFEPVFQNEEDLFTGGFNYDFGNFNLSLLGAYQETEYLSRQDYSMDVGVTFGATPLNPAGLWPVSMPAGGAGDDWREGPCNLFDGTAGVPGGCILPVDQTRFFSFDQADAAYENWTVEGRISTSLEGPFNFQLGGSAYGSEGNTDYYVLSNSLDALTTYGAPAINFPPLYPGFFNNTTAPDKGVVQDGWAAFGELYFDFTDTLKLTAGLRYNKDTKEANDTSVLFNSLDANATLGGLFGADPIWLRNAGFLEHMLALAANPAAELGAGPARLLEFWDAGGAYAENSPTVAGALGALGAAQVVGAGLQAGTIPLAALPAVIAGLPLPEIFQGTVLTMLTNPAGLAADPGIVAATEALNAIATAVPPVPGFGEQRFLTGSPSKQDWTEISGRIGIDWQVNDNSMIYGFFSRGYKPGGFNPAIPPQFQATSAFTFGAEKINAWEIGAKNSFQDGRLILNGAFFLYDYGGLQVTRIANNSSLNDNIDANIMGLELEGLWRPEALPGLAVDFGYSWLDTEVDGSMSVDPVNRTGGNPDWILLKNIDPGSATGVTYAAREADITQGVVDAALANLAALDLRNGGAAQNVSYAANAVGVSIPAYFSRNFLNALGVATSDGLPVDLDGNQLPNSPKHSIKLGLAYTWQAPAIRGSITARWDYYWQDDSYAREFNSIGDQIDSWDQHNASLTYESQDQRWTVRAWVRNLADDDNVTGKYITADTSGFFRNYFLTEPRIYGASVRFNFGG